MEGFAPVVEHEGVLLRSADVNGFTVGELIFPAGYVQASFEPDLPYLAVVIGGSLEKSLGGGMQLDAGAALTMPAGATHGARFGRDGARVVIVKARVRPSEVAFDRLRLLRGRGFALLARRLSAELRASDAAAPLAAEGVALELVAATAREPAAVERPPAWLGTAEELLRTRYVGLGELARAVGVPPVQVARAFRARHGVSVGEYGRRLRVEWAARQLASGDTPLAEIAAEAGFSDQSHFTRLFRRYVGTTPGRFRAFQRG